MNSLPSTRSPSAPRPRVLLLSPVLPDATGSGIEQRAHRWVVRLAATHEIDLVVVWRAGRLPRDADEAVRRLPVRRGLCLAPTPRRRHYLACALIRALTSLATGRAGAFGPRPEWAFLTRPARRELDGWIGTRRFDRAVCFRVQMLDYVLRCVRLGAVPAEKVEVDFDDWESETRRSLAAIFRRRGLPGRARRLEWQARQASWLERAIAKTFGCIRVAAPEDAAALAARFPRVRVAVMPNGPSALPAPLPPVSPAERRRAAFVGTLNYFPNEDAVRFFAAEVLPRLRAEDPCWTLIVAGLGAPPALQQALAACDGVEFVGAVADVAEIYRCAGFVVAPVRAGGGTKIKVVEGLAHGRPVIATTHAARGWGLRDGETFLRADSADEWVAACRRLAADADLFRRLADAGRGQAARFLPLAQSTAG